MSEISYYREIIKIRNNENIKQLSVGLVVLVKKFFDKMTVDV